MEVNVEDDEEEVTSSMPSLVGSASSGMMLNRGFLATGFLGSRFEFETGTVRVSETRLARLHSASESMPAKALRLSREDDDPEISNPARAWTMSCSSFSARDNPQPSCLRNLRTSSRTSSSHRLSLRPSEARMRMSSARTGRLNVCGCTGKDRVGWVEEEEGGPSWRGWLYYKKA